MFVLDNGTVEIVEASREKSKARQKSTEATPKRPTMIAHICVPACSYSVSQSRQQALGVYPPHFFVFVTFVDKHKRKTIRKRGTLIQVVLFVAHQPTRPVACTVLPTRISPSFFLLRKFQRSWEKGPRRQHGRETSSVRSARSIYDMRGGCRCRDQRRLETV